MGGSIEHTQMSSKSILFVEVYAFKEWEEHNSNKQQDKLDLTQLATGQAGEIGG